MFTETETAAIESLRIRLQDITNTDYSDSKYDLAKAYISEDATMWRYILAKSQDENAMDQSEEMFRSSVAWRNNINIKGLCNEWRSKDSKISARARMGQLCFYGGIMANKMLTGGPILVERLGNLDLPGLYYDECNINNLELHDYKHLIFSF